MSPCLYSLWEDLAELKTFRKRKLGIRVGVEDP